MKSLKIEINPGQIEDLKSRLLQTRWPDEIEDSSWEYGTNLAYLKELCNYWGNDFSWPEQEKILNQFDHFKTEEEDINLHFIYQKGKGTKNLPILLIHGWPDSFYRFIKLIPLLTDPDENGVAFDVVIPSIPGFGFSDIPKEGGIGPEKIAGLFNKLMKKTLGYNNFAIHGGDWGASIAAQMAMQGDNKIRALHLTNIPPDLFFTANFAEFGEDEMAYLQTADKWQKTEGAYLAVQGTKPQTLAYGLNDSPAGLAGWIIEKFNSWSDNNGHIEHSFTKDELLTNLSVYWFSQTAGSAARIYYETMHQPAIERTVKIDTPTYFAIFPKDCIQIPEAFGRRIFNTKSWKNMDRGGHFPALETPDLLAKDIRDALSGLRS
ncbi:pimeloyl-ACP methyl ester carboxylesterase [Pedobacter cryoconitis]|uniref:Pimeloyl-ACP methyl ester carboxylesterase n=1 Tax=Pedobacter cryoconitis TaxID=188932 RepID=A0A7W8ZPM0_9SPHI|nr:epoxide hydrolase family protein [Pedobacter cryoconitis]MBB5637695.1 pimeloyl-ACP methyl ester carboxylesterase [Pedobacter cryoconitis]